MSKKKNVEENALQDLSDQKLAQLSGGGLLAPVLGTVSEVTAPVVGLVSGTKVQIGGVKVQSPLANVGLDGASIGLLGG